VTKLYTDNDRYADVPGFPLVEAVHSSVRDLVRRKFAESGGDWSKFVFGASDKAITKADMEEIERQILATGYRFAWSSGYSVKDRPEIYQPAEGAGETAANFTFEHPAAITAPAKDGKEQRGVGDNVVRRETNTIGIARYIRTSEQVIGFMKDGVPPDLIAIIDDSGGTLTAPILEGFKGVICAGGTIRSHLGILTREYGIPCVMNARISGILNGDRVEIETTAPARTTESYQTGVAMDARIWRLA